VVWNRIAHDQVDLMVFDMLAAAQNTHTQCVFKILQDLSDSVNNYTTNVYVF